MTAKGVLELLAELDALEAKATKGPWKNKYGYVYGGPQGLIATPNGRNTDSNVNLIVALRNAYPQLRAALTAPSQGGRWEPIDTAPKDRDILLSDGVKVSHGGWITDKAMGAEYEGQFGAASWWSVDGSMEPTHWQPLPAPPCAPKDQPEEER